MVEIEGRCASTSDICLAVDIISLAQQIPGRSAYTVLVEAAENLRMSVGQCATFIVNAPDASDQGAA
jgi:hypothetical protein